MVAYTAAFGSTGTRAKTSRRGDFPAAPLLRWRCSVFSPGRSNVAPRAYSWRHEINVLFPTNRAARNPRTECANQPVAFISSFSEASSGRLSKPKTLAAFLPSWVLAAGLPCLAAFWLLAAPWACRARHGACVAQRGRVWWLSAAASVGAAGWLACSSAFDVIVNLLVRQNAGFRTSIPPK